jgi:hypothetical protein
MSPQEQCFERVGSDGSGIIDREWKQMPGCFGFVPVSLPAGKRVDHHERRSLLRSAASISRLSCLILARRSRRYRRPGLGERSIVTSWPVLGSRIVMAASVGVGIRETPDPPLGSNPIGNMVSNSLLNGSLSKLERRKLSL